MITYTTVQPNGMFNITPLLAKTVRILVVPSQCSREAQVVVWVVETPDRQIWVICKGGRVGVCERKWGKSGHGDQ
jgi:hypothetical protein